MTSPNRFRAAGPAPVPDSPEPLWREVLGSRMRELRIDRDLTLAQTADTAGISTQYLSEVERGRKEPSSEIIAAIAGALGTTLMEITALVSLDLTRTAPVPTRHTVTSQRFSGPVALAA